MTFQNVIIKVNHIHNKNFNETWSSFTPREVLMSILLKANASVYPSFMLVNKNLFDFIYCGARDLPIWRNIIKKDSKISANIFIEYCGAKMIMNRIKDNDMKLLNFPGRFIKRSSPNKLILKYDIRAPGGQVASCSNHGSGADFNRITKDSISSMLYDLKTSVRDLELLSGYSDNKIYLLRFEMTKNWSFNYGLYDGFGSKIVLHSGSIHFPYLFSYVSLGLVYKSDNSFIWMFQKDTILIVMEYNEDQPFQNCRYTHNIGIKTIKVNNILYNSNTRIISILTIIPDKKGSEVLCFSGYRMWECKKKDDWIYEYVGSTVSNAKDMTNITNLLAVGDTFLIASRKCPTDEKDFINMYNVHSGSLVK